LSDSTLANRELRFRLKSAFFSGLSSGIGLPFLWILSFGKAKESISPKAKALLSGVTAETKMMLTNYSQDKWLILTQSTDQKPRFIP